MIGWQPLVAGIISVIAAAPLPPAAEITVKPVVADGRVLASFAAPAAFDGEARDMIKSGMLLTFRYDVELRRPSTIWLDSTLAHVQLAAAVRYDNLTRTYQVSKLRDGKVVWSEQATDEAKVREWVTSFDQVVLDPATPLEPNAEYYVRVRLFVSPRRTVAWWWPFGGDNGSGRAYFTFIR